MIFFLWIHNMALATSSPWSKAKSPINIPAKPQIQLIEKPKNFIKNAKPNKDISNQGDKKLILIEVQCGEYLGEDDIIRYSDDYGRVK